ncbi:hypothetical protein [Arthrobacter zhaoguopingii]|uniref:hypothetical protein n=1 Tax=Arthrobacter zhaoguopingii TaxID=2681491 RepID=UPI001358A737|nr:hypothetical protein [Arthrobacter zhaoguopingii]
MGKGASGRIITGRGDSPLDSLVEQLWREPVATGSVRIVLDPEPDSGWEDAEDYWVVPSAARPTILIPRGHPAVTAAALLSYRGLRPVRVRAARTLLGVPSRFGLPPAPHRLVVQRRTGAAAGGALPLPLEELMACLDQERLYAAVGIRLGDNRKPTLQLFSPAGAPAGYAKLAWDDASQEAISTEAAALAEVGGGTGPMRAPRLLGTGSWQGRPYLITEPLPGKVRGVRGRIPMPTPQEMFALCPVERVDTLSSTLHYTALTKRVEVLGTTGDGEVARAAGALASLLSERNARVPVTARWHGDLVPWNTAREPDGQLWCWDWESSDADAAAGLDALHWTMSVRRESAGIPAADSLDAALAEAVPFLRAAGAPPSSWADIAAVYALVVAERAWSLALRNGGWSASRISRSQSLDLLAKAAGLLSGPGAHALR